jgi:hypothetical protein
VTAIQSVSVQAETARAQLCSSRARIIAAVHARFDKLEARVADAEQTKTVALEHELFAIDAALERLRTARQAVTQAAETAKAASSVSGAASGHVETAELVTRLDEADAQLLALPTAVVEPPHIGLEMVANATGTMLLAEIAGLGRVFAPRAAATLVADMRRHPDDARVAARGCEELARTEDVAAAWSHAGLAVISTTVVAAMKAHVGVEAVVKRACRVLKRITEQDGENGINFGLDAGAPAAIADAFMAHCAEDIAEQCCSALVSISSSPAGQAASVAAGIPLQVVAAMRAHPRHAAIALDGCRALGRMALVSAEGQTAAKNADAFGEVVNALCAHQNNADVVGAGCAALANMIGGAGDCTEAVFVFADILRIHAAHADVLVPCCRALKQVACFSQGVRAIVGNKNRILAAMFAVMRAHADTQVFSSGVTVLCRVAVFPRGMDAIVALDVSSALVALLRDRVHNADFIETCATTLLLFCKQACAKHPVTITPSAASALVLVLKTHPDNARVIQNACWVLSRAVAQSQRHQQAAVDAGVASAVIEALRAHPGDVKIAKSVVKTLSHIADIFSPGQQAVVNAGAASAVVAAMRAFAFNFALVDWSCVALSNMVVSAAGICAVQEAGAVDALVAALRVHSIHEALVDNACNTLAVTAFAHWASQTAAKRADTAAVLVAALRAQHFYSESAVEAMAVFAACDGGPELLVEADAVSVLVAAVRTCSDPKHCAALLRLVLLPTGRQAALEAGADAVLTAILARRDAGHSAAVILRQALEALVERKH